SALPDGCRRVGVRQRSRPRRRRSPRHHQRPDRRVRPIRPHPWQGPLDVKIYYDTEFLEDGETIELISIGMVAEDGRELYAVNADMPFRRVIRHDWLRENVVPSLPVAPCLPGHRCSSHGGGHLDTDHPDV